MNLNRIEITSSVETHRELSDETRTAIESTLCQISRCLMQIGIDQMWFYINTQAQLHEPIVTVKWDSVNSDLIEREKVDELEQHITEALNILES